jgi:Reverse transcriptase (RNA-dependent DNA polymerase)
VVRGLKELGFKQSQLDECVFFRGTTIFMVYKDDGILIDPDNSKIEQVMSDLQAKFEEQDEEYLSEYLGVKIQKHKDGSIEFTVNRFNLGGSEIVGPRRQELVQDSGHTI